jgi:GT2 family glycosyltransferase
MSSATSPSDLLRRVKAFCGPPLARLDDKELELIAQFAFLAILGRPADQESARVWAGHLKSGMSIADLRKILFESSESQSILDPAQHDLKMSVMGTDQVLTPEIWAQRVCDVPPKAAVRVADPNSGSFEHSGQYDVSAIASIYRAGPYIERLLDNVTSQTIFNRSELIIIDADSPDGENEIIAAYQAKFPNIVYRRINYRIGIYDAWNLGVTLARGKYLTNTNADDLRRQDSFEIQVEALEESGADIVYQNFFYTLDPTLSFDDVARLGFQSSLPIVNKANLFRFNSPHNAPMWRRQLHDEMGLFDTAFKISGDWEFWVRCVTRNRTFHLIETPHVVYYHNPKGLSTNSDSRSVEEGRWVWMRYYRGGETESF